VVRKKTGTNFGCLPDCGIEGESAIRDDGLVVLTDLGFNATNARIGFSFIQNNSTNSTKKHHPRKRIPSS
jgi:hypothetical protein